MYLTLEAYRAKNKGIKRLLSFGSMRLSLQEKLLNTRANIQMFRLSEKETIPLPSCLILQCFRSEYLVKMILSETIEDEDPKKHGWTESYGIKFYTSNEPYINVPKMMMKGCSCKGDCKASRRCSCIKEAERGNTCTKLTCKCTCYAIDKFLTFTEDDDNISSSEESNDDDTDDGDIGHISSSDDDSDILYSDSDKSSLSSESSNSSDEQ